MRIKTTRTKIKVDARTSVYLDIGRNDAGDIKDIFISEPSKFGNTGIGDMIADINHEIEEGFKVVK